MNRFIYADVTKDISTIIFLTEFIFFYLIYFFALIEELNSNKIYFIKNLI